MMSERTVADDDDPYAAAMQAKSMPNFTLFGQCYVEIWFCVLEKGAGKVVYDPQQHGRDRRCTALHFRIIPLREDQSVVERDMIAESAEWTRIVRPSLEATGTGLRDLHEKYVAAQLVPSGRKWKTAEGEEREATTLKFLGVFLDQATCEHAREEFYRKLRGLAPVPLTQARAVEDTDIGMDTDSMARATESSAPRAVAPSSVSPPDGQVALALKFLPNLWKASGKNPEQFARLLQQTTLIQQAGITIEHEAAVRAMESTS